MIIELINSYIADRINYLNDRYTSNIQLFNSSFLDPDFANSPVSQADKYYQVQYDEIHNDTDNESGVIYDVSFRIEFSFNIPNRNYNEYKNTVNNYIEYLLVLLNENNSFGYSDYDISYNVSIYDIIDLRISNASRFSGNYYMPTINVAYKLLMPKNEIILNTENIS